MAQKSSHQDVINQLVGQAKVTSRALADPHKKGGLKLAKESVKKKAKAGLADVLKKLFGGATK